MNFLFLLSEKRAPLLGDSLSNTLNTLEKFSTAQRKMVVTMLYTAQMAVLRHLPSHIEPIDITIKSAKPPGDIFAPTWDMVRNYKQGIVSESQYTSQYLDLMRTRYRKNKDIFNLLIKKAIESDIALVCYCPNGFCHRFLLVDILMKIEPKLQYTGEFSREPGVLQKTLFD